MFGVNTVGHNKMSTPPDNWSLIVYKVQSVDWKSHAREAIDTPKTAPLLLIIINFLLAVGATTHQMGT